MGISVVNSTKNRESLVDALPTWLALSEIEEIVIVDWDSTAPISDLLSKNGIIDSRIRVCRVDNRPYWVLSWALNEAVRLASGDVILKLDADYQLRSNFFLQGLPTKGKSFICGDWRKARTPNETHLSGLLLCYKSDFVSIGGYNEYITRYGFDDDDLYNRLSESGLTRIDVDPDLIHHMPHDDADRIINQTVQETNLQKVILHNRKIASLLPWDSDSRRRKIYSFVFNWLNYAANASRLHTYFDEAIKEGKSDIISSTSDGLPFIEIGPDAFFAEQFKKAVQLFLDSDCEIFLHAQADAEIEINDCHDTIKQAELDLARYNWGVYAPNVDWTAHVSRGKHIADELYEVSNTDCTFWFIHRSVIENMDMDLFSGIKYGWGIDKIVCDLSRKMQRKVIRNYRYKVDHPEGRGYPAEKAMKEYELVKARTKWKPRSARGDIAIITSFCNPYGYRELLDNYWTFRRHLGLSLYTAEISFNGEFDVPDALHFRGTQNNFMWQKERLLNLLIDQLDPKYEYIAWIDPNIIFQNPFWLDETVYNLQSDAVVQLLESEFLGPSKSRIHGAWAARREILDAGLYEYTVCGGGDSMMLSGWAGLWNNPLIGQLNPEWRRHYLAWGARSYRKVKGKIGCNTGIGTYLWHGWNTSNDQWSCLTDNNFDPTVDLAVGDNGLLRWSSGKTEMHELVARYLCRQDDIGRSHHCGNLLLI